eukprot:c18124_g1_i3.p1 GENE.c18124_g1_i3~~c18124_g1_i3.p1  ORF type:complete len:508 (+),score=72.60 c18124_g1_i3:33-1556(+)
MLAGLCWPVASPSHTVSHLLEVARSATTYNTGIFTSDELPSVSEERFVPPRNQSHKLDVALGGLALILLTSRSQSLTFGAEPVRTHQGLSLVLLRISLGLCAIRFVSRLAISGLSSVATKWIDCAIDASRLLAGTVSIAHISVQYANNLQLVQNGYRLGPTRYIPRVVSQEVTHAEAAHQTLAFHSKEIVTILLKTTDRLALLNCVCHSPEPQWFGVGCVEAERCLVTINYAASLEHLSVSALRQVLDAMTSGARAVLAFWTAATFSQVSVFSPVRSIRYLESLGRVSECLDDMTSLIMPHVSALNAALHWDDASPDWSKLKLWVTETTLEPNVLSNAWTLGSVPERSRPTKVIEAWGQKLNYGVVELHTAISLAHDAYVSSGFTDETVEAFERLVMLAQNFAGTTVEGVSLLAQIRNPTATVRPQLQAQSSDEPLPLQDQDEGMFESELDDSMLPPGRQCGTVPFGTEDVYQFDAREWSNCCTVTSVHSSRFRPSREATCRARHVR